MTNRKTVAVIPGEDAAPEAVEPSIALIDRLGLPITWTYPAVGQRGMDKHDEPFPNEARELIDAADATLFGATSGLSAMALFYLRWGKQTYANVRPSRWLPGARSSLVDPSQVDLAIVRENLEDLYVGVEGDVELLNALHLTSFTSRRPIAEYAPAKFALKVISEAGSERVIRHAFGLARQRKGEGRRGLLTCACKYNMLPQTDGVFRRVAERVAADFPDVEFETLIIDDCAHRLSAQPREFDVIVMPNLYGDILSDAAAGLIGGLGLAPSGCYGDDYAYFESAHGTAPDIAGKHIINPTATLLSAAMMLDYLTFSDAASALRTAIQRTYAAGTALTPDQGGSARTDQFCEAVAAYL